MGINASGRIVGFSDVAGGNAQHATLWNGTLATDLGTLGGQSSAAYAINSAGQVVGQSDIAGNTAVHATSWTGARATDLGTLGGPDSRALGINAAGLAVGIAQTATTAQHATLWSGAQIVDLNSSVGPALPSTVTLTAAVGINDSGQIAVYGDDSVTGGTDAFLLTPQ